MGSLSCRLASWCLGCLGSNVGAHDDLCHLSNWFGLGPGSGLVDPTFMELAGGWQRLRS